MNTQTKTIKFYIEHSGERAAGIHGFSDTVTITIDSGDPGGDEGEFEEFIKDSLKEWYDGAAVLTEEEYQEDMAHQERI